MTIVTFVNANGNWGGGEKILWLILKGLNEQSEYISPRLIVGSSGKLSTQASELGIPVNEVPLPPDERNLLRLVRWGRKVSENPDVRDSDVVYLNNFRSILFCSYFVWLSESRLFWHEHNIHTSPIRRLVTNLMAWLFPERILAVSNAVRDSYWSSNHKRIKVLHNALDLKGQSTDPEQTYQDIRQEYGVSEGSMVVTHPSVHQPWKGQHYFLKAVSKINNQTEAKFLLLGDVNAESSYQDTLKEIVKDEGIEDDVIFLDFIDDVMDIFHSSDIIVQSSIRPDPFPTAILEAMAARKPIVATRVGGVPEMTIDCQTGYLVPPRDVDAMADALLQLISNPERAAQFGEAGWRLLNDKFDYDSFVDTIITEIRCE